MNETAKDPLEIAQDHGAALLDNTTLAGIDQALGLPQTASFADVQSLACILEAVVLHESLVADSWYDSELIPTVMVNLKERAEGSGPPRPIFTMFDFAERVRESGAAQAETEEGLPMFAIALVKDALDRLERALRPDGGLDRQHELLVDRLGAGQSFSAHYLRPRPLREEIIDLSGHIRNVDEGGVLAVRIRALEAKIDERLLGATEELRLYSMFLLRAFYYEELAAAFSLSYVPHTFRAEALLALKGGSGGPSTWEFHMYTSQVAAAARVALAKQLDVTVNVPPIASWIAHDVNSCGDLLPRALEVRATEPARNFRRWVTEQERDLQKETRLTAVKKAKDELAEIVAELGVELLGKKRSGGHPVTLKFTTGITPLAGGEASTDVVLRSPLWLKRVLRRRRPYLTFFSRLTRELVDGDVVPFEKRLRQLPAAKLWS